MCKVGWRDAPMTTFTNCSPGEAVTLHIHQVVREDALLLVFNSRAERAKRFASCSSGHRRQDRPAILSSLSADELALAVAGRKRRPPVQGAGHWQKPPSG